MHIIAISFINTDSLIEFLLNLVENTSNIHFVIGTAMIAQMFWKKWRKTDEEKDYVFWCYGCILFVLLSICEVFAPQLHNAVKLMQVTAEFFGNTKLFKTKDDDEQTDKKEKLVKNKVNNSRILFVNKPIQINILKKMLVHIKEQRKPPLNGGFSFIKK